jgi:indole-3-glycerol phosphate synthase
MGADVAGAGVSILDKILARKREELATAKAAAPLASVRARAESSARPRGFGDALRRPAGAPVRAIAEIKRASPSAGPIRPGADPVAIASEYAAGGASAISVLTDRDFFDGNLAFLKEVRDSGVGVPLLRKDFLIDEYQVAEARACGADAILLIVAALDDALLRSLLAAAKDLGLDALVEVHTIEETERAMAAGSTIIGVNHRNLHTFEIDMTLTAQVARIVPAGTILVGESGIKTSADVAALGRAGAHAVLVGESLMRAPSPGAALRDLLGGAA